MFLFNEICRGQLDALVLLQPPPFKINSFLKTLVVKFNAKTLLELSNENQNSQSHVDKIAIIRINRKEKINNKNKIRAVAGQRSSPDLCFATKFVKIYDP